MSVVWLIVLAALALLKKAIERDTERKINKFAKSQKERENKD